MCVLLCKENPPVAINYSASFCFRAVSVYPRLYGTKQPMIRHLNVDLEIFAVKKFFTSYLGGKN